MLTECPAILTQTAISLQDYSLASVEHSAVAHAIDVFALWLVAYSVD